MRKLAYEYTMELKFSEPIYDHQVQLKCLPVENLYQKNEEVKYEISPAFTSALSKDGFGNTVISCKVAEPHTHFNVSVKGIVNVEYARLQNEECHPMYRAETALTGYDEAMASLLPESDYFFEQMMEISRNIYYEIYYTPGSTGIATSASQAFAQKQGVCQDFSHIMLAVVRHLGYPARYVAGMMSGEGETHAWIEVYYKGRWHGFDPTNNRPVNNQYIVFAKGRDYRDCAIDRGIFQADHYTQQEMKVHVSVKVI